MRTPGTSLRASRGFNLTELMIAVTIGMLIMATMTTIFVKNHDARLETERYGQQIENGRFAMQLLTDELRHSGYLAEYIPPTSLPATFLTKPDPCSISGTTIANVAAPAFLLHVQGYDNGAGAPTCISDLKAGTDVLVVRRASTCAAGTAGCDAALTDGTLYFQASLCMPQAGGAGVAGTELASTNGQCPLCNDYFRLDVPSNLTLHVRNCTTVANLRSFVTRIYFVANNDNAGDGIPTLKRAELGPGGFTIAPLVEGIENLQVEYGIDQNGDGVPDVLTADPDGLAATACGAPAAPGVCNWWNAMSANVHVLARSTSITMGYTDSKTYTLGLKSDGTDNVVGPFGDSYKRHAYESVIRFTNPAIRRQ